MACKDCFNGCVEITSDKCVKYTGPDFGELGISNGDSYVVIQENIANHLITVLNGTGIKFDIDDICDLVKNELPGSGDITIIDYVVALTTAACVLETRIEENEAAIAKIEGNYNVGCLEEEVSSDSGTHDILQAVLNLACQNKTDIVAVVLDLETNYAKINDLPEYFAELVVLNDVLVNMKTKMVPYTIVEYYGNLSVFDGSGAGIGNWERIFLCNGQNGTPDKRGRVGVGVIQGAGGGTLSPEVNPVNPGNPNYTLLSSTGQNSVALTVGQLPAHKHTASFSSEPHTHTLDNPLKTGGSTLQALSNSDNTPQTAVNQTGSSTVTGTVTISNTGSGEKHTNIQPVLACYYIMYIPEPA